MKKLKSYAWIALVTAVACFLYSNHSTAEGSSTYLSSPETALWERLLPVRAGLRVFTVSIGLLAFFQLLRGNLAGLWAWLAAILCSAILLFLPTFPKEGALPFATAVAAAGILGQMVLWTVAIRSLVTRTRAGEMPPSGARE